MPGPDEEYWKREAGQVGPVNCRERRSSLPRPDQSAAARSDGNGDLVIGRCAVARPIEVGAGQVLAQAPSAPVQP